MEAAGISLIDGVKFEMPMRHAIGEVNKIIWYMSLEWREEVQAGDKNLKSSKYVSI